MFSIIQSDVKSNFSKLSVVDRIIRSFLEENYIKNIILSIYGLQLKVEVITDGNRYFGDLDIINKQVET